MVKNLPAMWETQVWSLSWEALLEKEMATHFSILVWKIPWTEELGRLQYMESQRVGQDWTTTRSFFWGKSPGQHHPYCTFFFFLIEVPFLLSSHESVPASWRRYILIGKSHPYESLITWVRLHSLASHQISSLNPQISMTGYFLGLRSGRVGKSEGENCPMLLAFGSSVSLGLPGNGFCSRIPFWDVPAFLVLYVSNLIELEGL